MFKISIPQPCHEDWNKMNPNEQGRHCSSCAKTVVDFTGMNDDEVKYFFLNKKEERVCGRFKQIQLHQIVIELPQNIFNIEMPLWKKFLVACLLVFSTTLFSCDTKIKGELIQTEKVSQPPKNPEDELYKSSGGYVGMAFTRWDSIPKPPVTHGGLTLVIKGDVELIPEDSVKTTQIDPVVINKTVCDSIMLGIPIIPVPKVSLIDSVTNANKTKNPPKADSSDCNKMIYY